MCLQAAEPIAPEDDYGSLAERLQRLGGELLVRGLDEQPEFVEQPHEGVTLADKIGPEDRRLDPALGAAVLERRVRALNPHIGAFVEEPRMRVRRAAVSADAVPFGELAERDGRLLYGTSDGSLELLEVVPAGSKPMDASAYLRGHGVGMAPSRQGRGARGDRPRVRRRRVHGSGVPRGGRARRARPARARARAAARVRRRAAARHARLPDRELQLAAAGRARPARARRAAAGLAPAPVHGWDRRPRGRVRERRAGEGSRRRQARERGAAARPARGPGTGRRDERRHARGRRREALPPRVDGAHVVGPAGPGRDAGAAAHATTSRPRARCA